MSFKGRKNRYRCSCGGEIITIDRDHGTTPMLLGCRADPPCEDMMRSGWYPEGITEEPTHEWYSPVRRERRRLTGPMKDHVNQGGLLIRCITSGGEAA